MGRKNQSLTIRLFLSIFEALSWISILKLITRYVPKISEHDKEIVEIWVLGHFCLSFLVFLSWPTLSGFSFAYVILGYSYFRILEVVIYQINALLFDWYRNYSLTKPYHVRGYLRIVLLLLLNYAEITFWFAIFYMNKNWAISANGEPLDQLVALCFSFFIMTTFGYTNVVIGNSQVCARAFTLVQSVIAVFMVLLILARFISFIPKPETSDEVEVEGEALSNVHKQSLEKHALRKFKQKKDSAHRKKEN